MSTAARIFVQFVNFFKPSAEVFVKSYWKNLMHGIHERVTHEITGVVGRRPFIYE